MNNENYYVVQGWMVNDLKLKGLELSIYAIIYGFCQGDNVFSGTNKYLAAATSSTNRSVTAAISGLQRKGLINVKFEPLDNCTDQTQRLIKLPWGGNIFHTDRSNFPKIKEKTSTPLEKTSTNNIDNNINNNINNKRERFIKPTVQEIKDYAASQNLSIDAEQFFDHYESNGWRVGSHKMKDWKATVRNWARRSFGAKPQPTESFSEYDVTPDEVF